MGGSPAKRQKLDTDSKSSPAAIRNLDFFFGKKNQGLSVHPSNLVEREIEAPAASAELTDEQLAKKLQDEWNQEDAARAAPRSSKGLDQDLEGILDGQNINTKLKSLEGTEYSGNEDDVNMSSQSRPEVEHESRPSELKAKTTLSLQSAGSAEDAITSNVPFDQSPLTFEPSKYVADLQSHWAAEGGNASYAILTRCFVLVNSTQSRIKIVDTLVNLLRVIIEGDPNSLLPTVRTIISFLHVFLHRL